MNSKYLPLFVLILFLGTFSFAEELLTNESVIELSKSGLGADVIKSKIKASKTQFDIRVKALKELKDNKVPQDVINFMLQQQDPKYIKQEPKEPQIQKVQQPQHAQTIQNITIHPQPQLQNLVIGTSEAGNLDALPKESKEVASTVQEKKPIKPKKEKIRRGFIGISAGPSFAMDNYAKTKLSDPESSGFAGDGGNVNLNFSYRGNGLGFAAMWTANAHEFNKKQFMEELTLLDALKEYKIKSKKPILNQAILIGPMISIASKNVEFSIKALAGYAASTLPELEIITNSDGSYYYPETTTTRSESTSTTSLAYNLGATLRFRLTDRLGLSINADYFSINPEFKDVQVFESNNARQEPEFTTKDIKPHISMVNASIGLGYSFN